MDTHLSGSIDAKFEATANNIKTEADESVQHALSKKCRINQLRLLYFLETVIMKLHISLPFTCKQTTTKYDCSGNQTHLLWKISPR